MPTPSRASRSSLRVEALSQHRIFSSSRESSRMPRRTRRYQVPQCNSEVDPDWSPRLPHRRRPMLKAATVSRTTAVW